MSVGVIKGQPKGLEYRRGGCSSLGEACKIDAVGIWYLPKLVRLDIKTLQMDLYIDGNIAQMFSPGGAMRYFTRLLGVDARSLRPTVAQERPHPFCITSAAVENAGPSLAINARPLDYAISQAGTIVPQCMWSPTDARRISLNMPIFFLKNDRVTLGVPLLRAVGRNRVMLLGAGETAPVGNGSTLYIRINVCVISPSKVAHLCLRLASQVARLQGLDFADHDERSDDNSHDDHP